MSLRSLQFRHKAWVDRNFPDQMDHPYQPLLGLIEEVGELAHAHLKHEQGIRGMTGQHAIWAKEDAIGDIMIYLMSYCNANGIDLQGALEKTWEEVQQRDWVKYPETGGKPPSATSSRT